MKLDRPEEPAFTDDSEPDPKSGGPNVCVECGGTGRVGGEDCEACAGTGRADGAVKG